MTIDKNYELIIVGGGPAGITAGIYAARKKIKTLVLAKNFIGQVGVSGKIENWPGEKSITGPELITEFKNHLDFYDIELNEEKVISVEKEDFFRIKTEEKEYFSKAVIFATGRKPRKLGVPREEEFIGKGVVYCATCDAPFFQNKKVIVVGGGNAGVETAIEMLNYTKEVTLIEASDRFMADEFLVERAKEKGVLFLKNTKLVNIEGDSFVEKVVCEDVKNGSQKNIPVEGVFVQIGSVPQNEEIKELVELDEGGDVVIDFKTNRTKTEGLFAAGDLTNIPYKQIVIAAGEGAKAALSAYNFLRKNYK
jgi:NADH-dependent peroxiredoxin subunit F